MSNKTINIGTSSAPVDINVNGNIEPVVELKILGYIVPSVCPVQNTISGGGDTFIQNVKCVRLSDLTWTKYTAYSSDHTFWALLPDGAFGSSWDALASYCSNYSKASSYNNILNGQENGYATRSDAKAIYISDSSCTDASALNTKLVNVMFYYELATPVSHSIQNTCSLLTANNIGDQVTYSLSGTTLTITSK